ncbi:hypothetical protein E4Z66_10175 [Aliishimia ponticola]|uniref:BPL/LPL catalytic domain-containing protein n=1 Tax=Aliishimia ponticola TaxID=2499833 RepID=A0A4S4NGJ9_9RHOB|nr:hypothetical protein [Aliishimia ponticola]THH37278.1 hypothetical protein E4Z66_10175 [Aliishimia ponticola]
MGETLKAVDGVADGLALEADAFGGQGATVCLWSARRRALVCPANLRRKPGFDAARQQAAARGWPVYLRPTGGGAVPQGPGVLNLALAFNAGRTFTIEDGYRLLTQIIRDAIPADWTTGATPNSFCDGAWNLALSGRKVVGTAQRLRPIGGGRRRVLAHAMIMTDGDVATGAAAVGAFHHDLGLGPIEAGVHTTLSEMLPALAEQMSGVAASLEDAALREIMRATADEASAPS